MISTSAPLPRSALQCRPKKFAIERRRGLLVSACSQLFGNSTRRSAHGKQAGLVLRLDEGAWLKTAHEREKMRDCATARLVRKPAGVVGPIEPPAASVGQLQRIVFPRCGAIFGPSVNRLTSDLRPLTSRWSASRAAAFCGTGSSGAGRGVRPLRSCCRRSDRSSV